MPELPEVETVRRQLESEILGAVISEIEVRDGKVFQTTKEFLRGKTFKHITRRGKYLFWHFTDGSGLQVHLKMTGRYVINDNWYETAPHTRFVLTLDDGRKIYYWDTRKFGYIKEVGDIVLTEETAKKTLGPEPRELNGKYLIGKTKKLNRPIKEAILDQKIVAGVGNIYANDALWLARIDPRRKANSIKKKEVIRLIVAIRTVIDKGLSLGGASDNTYRDLYGGRGGYQNEFLVYGKTKGLCPACGKGLLYAKIGGEGRGFARGVRVRLLISEGIM